jgi:hypothetical protein
MVYLSSGRLFVCLFVCFLTVNIKNHLYEFRISIMISTNITRVNNGSLSSNDINQGAFSVVVACLTVVSVAISFIILITIRQGKPSNFFKWKVVERFTVYTTV